jgi:hypothetical protein
MKPFHPKAMPVILGSAEEQKLWLLEGDRDLLVPYQGEMEFGQLPDTLEHLYPDEEPLTNRVLQETKDDPPITNGRLFD